MADLFDAASERLALESGRPKSQERTLLLHPEICDPIGGFWFGDELGEEQSYDV